VLQKPKRFEASGGYDKDGFLYAVFGNRFQVAKIRVDLNPDKKGNEILERRINFGCGLGQAQKGQEQKALRQKGLDAYLSRDLAPLECSVTWTRTLRGMGICSYNVFLFVESTFQI
jgi:hypothetical protein